MRAPLVAAFCVLLLAAGGCHAKPAGTSPLDRDRLIQDMTSQLERGNGLRYRAEYQLLGGLRATVAQEVSPSKTAYGYPGGMLIISETERTSCDLYAKPPKCEIRIPHAGYAETMRKGFVTGPGVAELLRVASAQPVTINQYNTTIVGVPTSCVEVLGLADAQASNFIACVTADGVLASFSGVVNGFNIDLALSRMELRAPEETSLAVPKGAHVVDLRQ